MVNQLTKLSLQLGHLSSFDSLLGTTASNVEQLGQVANTSLSEILPLTASRFSFIALYQFLYVGSRIVLTLLKVDRDNKISKIP